MMRRINVDALMDEEGRQVVNDYKFFCNERDYEATIVYFWLCALSFKI